MCAHYLWQSPCTHIHIFIQYAYVKCTPNGGIVYIFAFELMLITVAPNSAIRCNTHNGTDIANRIKCWNRDLVTNKKNYRFWQIIKCHLTLTILERFRWKTTLVEENSRKYKKSGKILSIKTQQDLAEHKVIARGVRLRFVFVNYLYFLHVVFNLDLTFACIRSTSMVLFRCHFSKANESTVNWIRSSSQNRIGTRNHNRNSHTHLHFQFHSHLNNKWINRKSWIKKIQELILA